MFGWLLVSLGCKGDAAPQPVAPEGLQGQLGSVAVGLELVDGDFYPYRAMEYAHALFVDQDGGLVNAAGCAPFLWPQHTCVMGYPSEGVTAFAPTLEELFGFNTATFFHVGPSVEVGPGRLEELEVYPELWAYHALGDGLWAQGEGGLSITETFAPYEGTADFTYADPIEVTAPVPGLAAVVGPQDTSVELAWVAPGGGDVLLETEGRVTHLADDGHHTLDLAPFAFEGPIDMAYLTLGRMTLTDVDASGNTIRVQTRADQRLGVVYRDLKGYADLGDRAAEDCAAAVGTDVVSPGRYWGDLTGARDDHQVDSSGTYPDVVVPIELAAGDELAVTLHLPTAAFPFLLDDTCGTVLASPDPLTFEGTASFTYRADQTRRAYVVVDAHRYVMLGGEVFALEWTVTPP